MAALGRESNAVMLNTGITSWVRINQSARNATATYLLAQSFGQHIKKASIAMGGNVYLSSFYISESRSIQLSDSAQATVQNVLTISTMGAAKSQTCIIYSIS